MLAEKNAGKPPHVIEKIVESGLKTYYKEVCLLDQPFVHDRQDRRPGGQGGRKDGRRADRLRAFVRYALGEGIEKPAEEA